MKKSQDKIKQEQDYVAFLKKRLDSVHFQNSVTQKEIEKTKYKYDKAKLKLNMLLKGQI